MKLWRVRDSEIVKSKYKLINYKSQVYTADLYNALADGASLSAQKEINSSL